MCLQEKKAKSSATRAVHSLLACNSLGMVKHDAGLVDCLVCRAVLEAGTKNGVGDVNPIENREGKAIDKIRGLRGFDSLAPCAFLY